MSRFRPMVAMQYRLARMESFGSGMLRRGSPSIVSSATPCSALRGVCTGRTPRNVRWRRQPRAALGHQGPQGAGHLNWDPEAVFSVAFSSDGLQAVSGGKDTTVRVWNIADGKEQTRLSLPSGESVWSLGLSSDNRHVLTASDSRVVRLWDVERSEEAYRFDDHHDVVWCVALSADGTRARFSGGGLSDGQQDYVIRLWDIEKRMLMGELKGAHRCSRQCCLRSGWPTSSFGPPTGP